MAQEEKAPRWADDPPPGFKPDGTSMIVPSSKDVKWPEEKIDLGGGVLVTPEELAAMQDDEDDDDLSDLDDIDEEVTGV